VNKGVLELMVKHFCNSGFFAIGNYDGTPFYLTYIK